MDPEERDREEILALLLDRFDALTLLAEGPVRRRTIEEDLGVSRTTVYRLVSDLTEAGLADDDGGGVSLTALGELLTEEASAFTSRVDTVLSLSSFLEVQYVLCEAIPLRAFRDANITEGNPSNPYRPLTRFVDLLGSTDRLRGLDKVSVSPFYAEAVHEWIHDGLEVDLIYPPRSFEELRGGYGEKLGSALETGNLTIHLHPDVPFGVGIFDERVGLGWHDEDTGVLTRFVDTDDPEAYAWAERIFEDLRAEAKPLDTI